MGYDMFTEDEERALENLCRPYKSHLSFAQLSEGIGRCLENARSLYEDAAVIIESGRYARGMSLLVSCLEELGKVHVLASMGEFRREINVFGPRRGRISAPTNTRRQPPLLIRIPTRPAAIST